MKKPVVSIVMVAFGGGWSWVARALDALQRNTEEAYEVILVDNAGAEERSVARDAMVEVIPNQVNVGFGPGSNQGAARARAEVLCFLNTDAFVERGWLPAILDRLADHAVGAVFPTKLNANGSIQEAGAFVTRDAHAYVFGGGDDPNAPQHNFPRDVDFGSAACMAVTRQRFDASGGFDPAYRLAYYEDADLCFRLREDGLRVVYEPRSRVTHVRTVSADFPALADIYSGNREIFLSRWSASLEQRPGLDELQGDERLRLAARDFHAHERILFLGASDQHTRALASAIASANPRTRVTLLGDEKDASFARELLAAGVEVALGVHDEEWLSGRAGHYSHVVAAPDARWRGLRAVLRATQPQASVVDVARLEAAARADGVARITSSLGIAG